VEDIDKRRLVRSVCFPYPVGPVCSQVTLLLECNNREISFPKRISDQETNFTKKIKDQELLFTKMISNQDTVFSKTMKDQEILFARLIRHQDGRGGAAFTEIDGKLALIHWEIALVGAGIIGFWRHVFPGIML